MKKITTIGIKKPGKPWVIRHADRGNIAGAILPDLKQESTNKDSDDEEVNNADNVSPESL